MNTGKGGIRPPTIKIEGKGIKCVEKAKYLGVTIGTRLNIIPHIHEVTAKGKRVFHNLSPLIRVKWG